MNVKVTEGKVPLANLCLKTLGIVARVFEYGNKKYGKHNWCEPKVAADEDYAAAIMRHLSHIQAGEMLDPDSGLPHWAHIEASAHIALRHQTQPTGGLWR